MRYLLIAASLISTLQIGYASTKSEQENLLKVDRKWSAISSAGKNVDSIVSYWTDDAVVSPNGQPSIKGKVAIRQYVKESLAIPGFHISWIPETASVSADGSMGYTTGTNEVTVPGSDGKPMTMAGRYVTIWKHVRGTWKCVLDSWNSSK